MRSEVRSQKSEDGRYRGGAHPAGLYDQTGSTPGSGCGFTLIELTVVIFLMLLMLAIVSVNFASQLSHNKLNSTARSVAAALNGARSAAYLKGETQIFEFDLEGRKYGLSGHEGKDIPEDVHVKAIDPLLGEMEKGKWQVTFYPEGGVSGGSLLLTSRAAEIRIKIDPIAGSAVVDESQKNNAR